MKFIKKIKKWQTTDGCYFNIELKARGHQDALGKVSADKPKKNDNKINNK